LKLRVILSVIIVSFSLSLVAGNLSVESKPALADQIDQVGQPIRQDLPLPQDDPSPWVTIGTGIEYHEFVLPDPNNVFVARMERDNLATTLESSIAQGKVVSGRETVSSMARRHDQAINFWGESWGARNQVVVAINGSFFDYATGIPYRGIVHSSWYAKRFDDYENGTGFAWTLDRLPFIGGGCLTHPTDKNVITFLRLDNYGKTQTIDGVNVPRADDQLVLYTPQYDARTHTSDGGTTVEVLVEMTEPTMLISGGKMITGYVREIRKKLGSTPIPFNYVVLSAHGAAQTKLLNNIAVGDTIGFSQKIKDYEVDAGICNSNLSPFDWDRTYASIGGSFHFLKDGKIQSFPNDQGAITRHPRTAIAYNDNYIYFIVVDGRNPFRSIGMTIDELATFTKDTLGAKGGIAQDGGGSSTMVVNGNVVNNTFCNNLICPVKTFIPLVAGSGNSSGAQGQVQDVSPGEYPLDSTPDQELMSQTESEIAPDSSNQSDYEINSWEPLQRLVANGMMMVVVEPMTQTLTYTPGETVVASEETPIYLGPGSNYATLETVPAGTQGVITVPLNGLDGVLAKGSYWWQVDFSGKVGWVTEESMVLPTPLSTHSTFYPPH
jgi:hypothetical protein